MSLDTAVFRAHLNMTADEVTAVGEPLLARILVAAVAHTETQLGFKLDDVIEFPEGPPADVEHAVFLLAAHWFNERETVVAGVAMMAIPFGFDDIIRSHRRYTFG